MVALCAYVATFAVFFFTALYLAEVAGYSGYQIAVIFLPMTALMTLTSVLAGRWTVTAGSRWSVVTGYRKSLCAGTAASPSHDEWAPCRYQADGHGKGDDR